MFRPLVAAALIGLGSLLLPGSLVAQAIPAGSFPTHSESRVSAIDASPFPEVQASLEEQVEGDRPSLWRHLLVGTGVGAAVGYALGWSADSVQDAPATAGSFSDSGSAYHYRVTHGLIGAASGALLGGSLYLMRR